MAYHNLNSSAAHSAIRALEAIPFEEIIGGPLGACVEAQRISAETTVEFIDKVGLRNVPVRDKDGNVQKDEANNIIYETEAIYVCFQFIQGGRMVRLNVPILSIVPIPYISINTIDISFKANITGMSRALNEDSDSYSRSQDYTQDKDKRRGLFLNRTNTKTKFHSAISSKKDSKATQDSQYSVEYTMDVNLHASQDSMPAGMAKMLEMIGSAMDLCSVDGQLEISDTQLMLPRDKSGEDRYAVLEVSYKTPEGVYSNSGFVVSNKKGGEITRAEWDRYSNKYHLKEPGEYVVQLDQELSKIRGEQKIVVQVIDPNKEVAGQES